MGVGAMVAKAKEGKAVSAPRLHVAGVVQSFRRWKNRDSSQVTYCSLVKLEGVETTEALEFYLGKRVAYVYKARTKKQGSMYRVLWGKVCRAHGSNGVARCKFAKNLPGKALGGKVRVMLYPSRV